MADDRDLDLAAALGAERETSTQILSLYGAEGSWFFRIKEYDE